MNHKEGPSILFIVPATLAALRAKGVEHLLHQRDEGGYFKQVITVHPNAEAEHVEQVSPNHTVYEFSINSLRGWNRLPKWCVMAHYRRVKRKVLELIREYDIDIVRSNSPFLEGMIALYAGRKAHIPVVVSLHADYMFQHKLDPEYGAPRFLGSYFWSDHLSRYVLKRADQIFPISQYLADRYINRGIPSDKFRVFRHYIDAEFWQSKTDPRWKSNLGWENDRLLACVGRLSRQKYVYDVLKTFEGIAEDFPDTRLVMVGDGEERQAIMRLAEESRWKERISLVGPWPKHAILALYRNSELAFCMLAGFSLLEAMAASAPVVCYDVEWHREVVEHGVNALMAPMGDTDSLQKHVRLLLCDPRRAQEMGESARKTVLAKHSRELVVAQHVRIYEDVLRDLPQI